MNVRRGKTRIANRPAAGRSPRHVRASDVQQIPTVRTEPDPVAAAPASAEEEAAAEAVRRMVEAAYT